MKVINTQPHVNMYGQTVWPDAALANAKRVALAYVLGGLVSAVKETLDLVTAGRGAAKPVIFADCTDSFHITLDVWWDESDAAERGPDMRVTIYNTPGRNEWRVAVSSDVEQAGRQIMHIECQECSGVWEVTLFNPTEPSSDTAFCALLIQQVRVNREFEWENMIDQALEHEKRKREEVDDD